MRKPSSETVENALAMLKVVDNAEFQYVLGVFTELKELGRELQTQIMEERRDFYDGKSTAKTRDESESRELQWENEAREQANIIYGRAQERGVSENMLNLISYAIEQYI